MEIQAVHFTTTLAGVSRCNMPPAMSGNPQTAESKVCDFKDTRRLASGMSPIAVERVGLAGALTALSAQATELYGLQVVLEIDPLLHTPVGTHIASQLYRIVQEATSNVARHARAKLLKIAVQFSDAKLNLIIADDGIGVAELPQASERTTGLGLRIMRYRAERIGGSFQLESCSPHGTLIRVSCPLGGRTGC